VQIKSLPEIGIGRKIGLMWYTWGSPSATENRRFFMPYQHFLCWAGQPHPTINIARLARRSWSLAQYPPELRDHLEWRRAYYHFVRPMKVWSGLSQPGTLQWKKKRDSVSTVSASGGGRILQATLEFKAGDQPANVVKTWPNTLIRTDRTQTEWQDSWF
jgi:hypothetical protein